MEDSPPLRVDILSSAGITGLEHSSGGGGGPGTFDLTAIPDNHGSFRAHSAGRGSSAHEHSWGGLGAPHAPYRRGGDAAAVAEAELGRMAEAEEEQCRADRFWGLDREDWEQRRAARGMYAEDVAAWRLREARKVAARQAVWEAEDREGRAALAAELGRHERRAR
eukprot:CAMPEP_0206387604 /NCGR_PEP_ID=MMETSP0294-20121207/16726_1 /ASSEMBLY_ACC=CAM_ASM_000327 /TAXON_ID=39354 /ORGANISM="Heterosigma akashiwo, Strain CCMP2393" /LENGTH=164 /DNA_ID=CAMNT_0053839051 /DNA_START=68 /DNA_END=558 /DNA_ORIENTATION=-